MGKSSSSEATSTGQILVIVESPTKATTLRKFLGKGYRVEASVGHVRDLVERKSDLPEKHAARDKPWVKYGVNVENHFEPLEEIYVVPPEKKRQVDLLKEAMRQSDQLFLATDDDREGEAISWHLREVLRPSIPSKRLVFHEITKDAILRALTDTRELDEHLVHAQRARRVVDRLFGWDVSEVLWRKIKPGLSAGRVQSVALRLLVQRERERIAFRTANYWDIDGHLLAQETGFDASLIRVGAQRVASGKDFDDTTGQLVNKDLLLLNETAANQLLTRLGGQRAVVEKVDVKPQSLRPSPPFTTSTLQQEANRKLRFSARQTMQVAQRLYENGFITYMRTDSVVLSEQAVQAARDLIGDQYGDAYLPAQPRRYQTRTANAQEAHEAIRPAGTQFPTLATVQGVLGADAGRLFELIWKRTVASQMPDAQVEQTAADISVADTLFRASGRTTRFPGFLKAYVEGSDDPDAALSDRDRPLPLLRVGDSLQWQQPPLTAQGHQTRPPARLTEASLVKALEEKGIGRPSTYAAILQNLLDKLYCFRRGNALVPTFMGMAVTQLLEQFMPHLVDYNFTAEMEARLDAIARGEAAVGDYLNGFYEVGFQGVGGHAQVRGLRTLLSEVRDQIDPSTASASIVGLTEAGDQAVVRIGRFGTFVKIGERTASVPDDIAPDEMTAAKALELVENKAKGEAPMGVDPATSEPIFLRNGRFGWYVQRGLPKEDGEKPKAVSLSKGMRPEALTLELAILQLATPRTLGRHPRLGDDIVAHVGRYGDYVKCGEESRTLPPGVFAFSALLADAVTILDKPKSIGGKEHVRDIGVRERDGKTISLWVGRFGPYLTDGTVNKTLRDTDDLDALTVAAADVLLLAAAEAKAGKLLGIDTGTGTEVRLLDGKFGPYVTNGAFNASLPRGTTKDEYSLEEAVARLIESGRPVKAKPSKGRKTAGKTGKSAPSKGKASADQDDVSVTGADQAPRTKAVSKPKDTDKASKAAASKSQNKTGAKAPSKAALQREQQAAREKAAQAALQAVHLAPQVVSSRTSQSSKAETPASRGPVIRRKTP